MAEPNEKPEMSVLSTLSGWVQLFIALVLAGGILWAALMFFSPLRDADLTVLIKQSIPINVPDEVEYSPIQLNYEGVPINRATIIELKVENTGKTVIRPDKGRLIPLSQVIGFCRH